MKFVRFNALLNIYPLEWHQQITKWLFMGNWVTKTIGIASGKASDRYEKCNYLLFLYKIISGQFMDFF